MKRLLIIFLLMFGMSLVFADCDMAAMIAKTGYSISNLGPNPGPGAYDDPDEFIDFFIEYSSASTNPDGYGITYTDGNGYFPYINTTNLLTQFYSAQAWYVTAQNINSNNYYYSLYPGPMEAARDAIKLDTNDVAIVLGHVRRSNTALGNHPFRFIYDTNTTFQFIHNGGIDGDIKSALYTALGGTSWFNTHPSNWITNFSNHNSFIDSEILFHWIMKNIIDNNGDILSGIQQALTATVGSIDLEYEFRNPYILNDISHNVVNFVLTDGETLYIFKNGYDDWDHHLLSWQENDNNSYTVKTRSVLSNVLDQFDLVILSRDDDPIVYNDFFDLDLKIFTPGVTWVSFPRLNEQGTFGAYSYEQAYYENGLPGLLQSTLNSDPTINDFIRIDGFRDGSDIDIQYYDDEFHDNDFENMLFRHEGYKVEVSSGADQTILAIDGDRLESYSLDMTAMEYYWLGYYIPYSQNIEVAFGEDFWPDVNKVWAEDWFYDKMNNNRGIGEPELPANSTTGKTLEYGKMYIVQMYRDADGFSWDDSGTVEEPEKKQEAENFTYTEKADYEAIDIIGIPENVTEIGVFEEDVCVGAVVVTDSCEQVLAYITNANRDQIPLTFELIVGSRGITSRVKDYKVLNQMTGQFEPNVIISGRQDYSAIKFTDFFKPEENIMPSAKLHGNYPNPFNPETTISFNLTTEGTSLRNASAWQVENTELTIYNMKGQKVKQLFKGHLTTGGYSFSWNGTDEEGKPVSSGLYLYKLKVGDQESSKKMLLLK